MKIQYKHQGFQVEAAQAVVDVFRGQPLQEGFAYRRDMGRQPAQEGLVPQKLSLEIEGVRNNNKETNICAIERDNRLNLVAVVEGVVKGLYEWIKELTIRFQKKQEQDDKARKQSQQKAQERNQRGYRFKR